MSQASADWRIYECVGTAEGVRFEPPLPLVMRGLHAWSAARQAFVPIDGATPVDRVFLPGTRLAIKRRKRKRAETRQAQERPLLESLAG